MVILIRALLFLCCYQNAFAQNDQKVPIELPEKTFANEVTPTQSVAKTFVGVVQYVGGDVQIQNASATSPASYKSILRIYDRLHVNSGYIKVITDNYCVFVLYRGSMTAPQEPYGKWTASIDSTVRWNCPPNRTQMVEIAGKELLLSESELLYKENLMHVYYGKVQSGSKSVRSNEDITFREGRISLAKSGRSPRELYSWLTDDPLPLQSRLHNSTRPNLEPNVRISLGGSPIGMGYVFHTESHFSYQAGKADGVHLQAQFKSGPGAYLVQLGYLGSRNKWDDDRQNSNSGPSPDKNLDFEMFSLSGGWRFAYSSSLGVYTKFGINRQRYKVFTPSINGQQYVSSEIVHTGIDLGLGIEKIFFSNSWIAFKIGSEVIFSRTLHKESFHSDQMNQASIFGEDQHLSTLIGFLYLGPVFQF